jgi:hypothetical protein
MADFGGAERFAMQAAGFLELERGFLGDRQAIATADQEQAGGLQASLRRLPIQGKAWSSAAGRVARAAVSVASWLHAATSAAMPASEVMNDLVAATEISGPAHSGRGTSANLRQRRLIVVDQGHHQAPDACSAPPWRACRGCGPDCEMAMHSGALAPSARIGAS